MIRKEDLEIAKLSLKGILITLFDATVMPFFESSSIYYESAKEHRKFTEKEKNDLRYRIYYLKKRGYINTFTENKEKYLELTPKGLNHIKKLMAYDIKISKPERWDKKWRIVIFDIPEKKREERDIFRKAIKNAGFVLVQKSVHIYPFECTKEISELSARLEISDNVVIMISEIFQGEQNIIEEFIDKKILFKDDLK